MEIGIYRHYKGQDYLVLGTATLEESLAEAVIYQALYGEYTLWIRERKLFEEHLDLPDYPYSGPRFRFIAKWTQADKVKHPKVISPFLSNEIPN